MKVLVLRYGEINLKGKNRNLFERILFKNISLQLEDYKYELKKERNRIYLYIDNDYEVMLDSVKRIPGIQNISLADVCDSDIESIKDLVLLKFNSEKKIFAIRVRRGDKKFEYTSQETEQIVGSHMFKNFNDLKVNLTKNEQEINIEIRKSKTFVFTEKIDGMGGLPIGSGGYGIVLLSGGIDSPVAAIECMKRGVRVDCLHFHTPPYTSEKALSKVADLICELKKYDKRIKLYTSNITDLQLNIKDNCKDSFSLLMMRRSMYKLVDKFALDNNYQMIITGESLGQVASQTIESITMTNMVTILPVIRPLITTNKMDIIKLASRYNTYDISIQPYDDACSIFAPKKPVIKPKLEETEFQEQKINVDLLNDVEIVEVQLNEKDTLLNEYL